MHVSMYIFQDFKMALMAEHGSRFFLLIFLIVCYVYGISDTQTYMTMQISVEQHQGTSQCVNTIWNTQAYKSHKLTQSQSKSTPQCFFYCNTHQMHIHSHAQCLYGLPSFGIVFGLHWRYLLEKCDSTRSLSCVSPTRANSLKNILIKRQQEKQNEPVGHIQWEQIFK